MERKEILDKVREHVPFVWDTSRVEFGGTHVPLDESVIRTHKWQNGWREEGHLLLDANLQPTGKLYHVHTNGARGIEPWEEEKDFQGGEPCYLLAWDIKFDTDEEEYAALYRIEK
ncbi:MAG: hypothetical protein WC276_11475 [Sedimentibacter sp.]|jgi:hypothetical protein